MFNHTDHDVDYYFECVRCEKVYLESYDSMVQKGWRVIYKKGFVCPKCAESVMDESASMPEAKQHMIDEGWCNITGRS